MSKFPTTRWALMSVSLVTAGCAHLGLHRMHSTAPATVAQAATPARALRRPAGPSDANIAAIMLAANNTNVSYARLAPARAQSHMVKAYAQHMAMDHARINSLLDELLTQSDIAAEDNATSLAFRDESAAQRDLLRALDGSAFDSAYMANEVTFHAKLLASIDTLLLPNAGNPQLKQFITSFRPAVAAHLAHAEQVRAGMMAAK